MLAFANALSSSPTREQEYTFIVREDTVEWIRPFIFGPCRLATVPESTLRRRLRVLKPLHHIWLRLNAIKAVRLPKSSGFVESNSFDLVHFPTQDAYLTELPSIYQPWDLQHSHHPEFFSKTEVTLRDRFYSAFCQRARYVCVQTNWGKRDLVENLQVPSEKIEVIGWGSVLEAYKTPSAVAVGATAKKYRLPSQFFFYPAVTWPHKNHEVIIRALGILKRQHARSVDVYFSGLCNHFRAHLDALALDLRVSERVHFLGFIPAEELQSLFAQATALVFASKFEGFGLPILESFQSRLPVLCSNATVLPEVAQDGALYFDPDSPTELAGRMKQILDDVELRKRLVEQGLRVLSRYSIKDTAARFQALYERTAARSSRYAGV